MKIPDKKYIGAFAVGALWGIIIAFIGVVFCLRIFLIREYESVLGFDETVKAVAEKAQKTPGWVVKSSPCSLPKTEDKTKMWAITLCNAKYALAMLNDQNSRKIASVIPCNFAIYQKNNGKTYLSRLNVSLFGLLIGGKPGSVFPSKVAPEQERMLEGIIK